MRGTTLKRDMGRAVLLCAALAGCVALPIGCSRQNNTQIQQDARQATDQTKAAAKDLKQETRQGLEKAENAVDATASGIKQGIHDNVAAASPSRDSSGTGANGRVDLNSASKAQLETLPGVTPAKATAIIANRPYATPDDTVAKHVLTEPQFDRIAAQVTAN